MLTRKQKIIAVLAAAVGSGIISVSHELAGVWQRSAVAAVGGAFLGMALLFIFAARGGQRS
jgi:hypothetical protein